MSERTHTTGGTFIPEDDRGKKIVWFIPFERHPREGVFIDERCPCHRERKIKDIMGSDYPTYCPENATISGDQFYSGPQDGEPDETIEQSQWEIFYRDTIK
jgi:hypothetical protein